MTSPARPLGRLLRDLAACDVADAEYSAWAQERADMLALADYLDRLAESRSNPAAYRARAARLRRMAADLEAGR